MIHEHEDLVLASAAIDFELTETESARLREAVADCPVCAERAAAYRRQFHLLADLPRLEPSPATRQAVLAAAMAGRRPRSNAPLLLLAAALVIGAALAVVAAAGGAFNQKPKLLAEYPPVVDPASSPPPSPSAPAATPTPVPSGPAGPSGTPLTFAHDALAQVVSSNLRLRSQPRIASDSIKFEPFLQVGDRMFVVDGPVTGSGHDWYQVATWRPADPSVSWPIGWVASADIDGTPWIAAATPTCPDQPTVADLAGLRPAEALACYGRRTLTLHALVSGAAPGDPCPTGSTSPCLGGPTWLAGTGGWIATPDSTALATDPPSPGLTIARNPDASGGGPAFPPGRLVTINGSFDDPAAATCALEGSPASVSTLTATDAVLRCRTTFVAAAVTADPGGLTLQAPAVTVTPGLRVRSLPVVDATSERYDPLLDQGTRLFVIGGPVVGSGYDWYRVIAPTVTRTGGGPMVGWVAVAGKDGEIWAESVDLACPAVDGGPIALGDLARLTAPDNPDGGLGCFGSVPVQVRATVTIACPGPDANATATTGWIAAPARMTIHLAGGTAALDARVQPALAGRTRCDTPGGIGAILTGRFDDPDAATCASGAATADLADVARYRCRSLFVVTDLAVAP